MFCATHGFCRVTPSQVPFAALFALSMLVACVDYGSPATKGAVITTSRVSVVVPRDYLRVSPDNPHPGDLVMYEDFSGGLHGLVFLVQSRQGSLGTSLVEELELFSGPEASLLSSAQMVESSHDAASTSISYLLWLPPDATELGRNTIVHRAALYMLGTLDQRSGRIYRLQVAWNPLDALSKPDEDPDFTRQRAKAAGALEELRRGMTPVGG